MKRPAFQFYPADWRKETALQLCSITARGVWWELICLMHECEPYGHLALRGRAIPDDQAARLVGAALGDYQSSVAELEAGGIFSRTADGVIYCRRMVRDEKTRNARSDAGRLGGNPSLRGGVVNGEVKQTVKEKPTPSTASASSASATTGEAARDARPARKRAQPEGTRLDPLWTLPVEWAQWALEERPAWTIADVEQVGLVFKDHWHSAVGAKARRADWLATWRNWVRNERRTYGELSKGPPSGVRDRRVSTIDAVIAQGKPNGRDITGIAERVDRPAIQSVSSDLREQGADDVR